MNPKLTISILYLFVQISVSAQVWTDAPWMKSSLPAAIDGDENQLTFTNVEQLFSDYWQDKQPQKHRGYMPFQRWAYHWKHRLGSNSEFINIGRMYWDAIQQKKAQAKNQGGNGSWQAIGPFTIPSNGGGAGRLNCIEFHPTDTNIIWVGSAGGGLWKSLNGGNTWTSNTDELAVLGVTDVIIHPSQPDTMYLATGDANGNHNLSLGVLRSYDGGNSWHQSGLIFDISQTLNLSKLLLNQANPKTLLAGASNGIYITHDGGDNWSQTFSTSPGQKVMDLEYHPADSSIAYAAVTNGGIYKTTDGGHNWFKLSSGLPPGGFGRIELAVSPAVANTVYALMVESTSGGFYRFYRSTDAGASWLQMSASSPNILGFQKNGNDNFGQGFYDLAMDVSPTNINEIFVGGINIWHSTNGGASWSINTYYAFNDNNPPVKPYVHADHHEISFRPGNSSTVFSCNDGGLFKTTNNGIAWYDLSQGLFITQFYRLGSSQSNTGLFLAGTQDNGTERFNSGVWKMALDGDGMNCFFDYSNNNYAYAEFQFGQLRRSTNMGSSFPTIINPSGISNGNFITPFDIDPINAQTLYVAYEDIFKSTNRGNIWTKIGDFNGLPFECMAIAPANPAVIYASKLDTTYKIYKTTNGGSSWLDVTNDTLYQGITSITIHPTDPNIAWLTSGGLNDIKKVLKTTDGGNTWTDRTLNLSKLPVNCALASGNQWDGIYIGNDIGVYYIDSRLNEWVTFSDGLPNVMIRELEYIQATNTIRAATFGRGIWESPSFNCPQPITDFAYNLSGLQAAFYNTSQSDTTVNHIFTWHFGDGDTSSHINPIHTYAAPGEYEVMLLINNSCGLKDTINKCIRVQPAIADYGQNQSYFAGMIGGVQNLNPAVIHTSSKGGYLLAANKERQDLNFPSGKKYSFVAIRTNDEGKIIWNKEISTGRSDSVSGIIELPGSKWVLFGKSMPDTNANYDLSYYLLNEEGIVISSGLSGTDSSEWLGSCILDASGDIVLFGQSAGKHLLIKMDTFGNNIWAKLTSFQGAGPRARILTERAGGYWAIAGFGNILQVLKVNKNGNNSAVFNFTLQHDFTPVSSRVSEDSSLWIAGNYMGQSNVDIGLICIGSQGQVRKSKLIGTAHEDRLSGFRIEHAMIHLVGITNSQSSGNTRFEPFFISGDTSLLIGASGNLFSHTDMDLHADRIGIHTTGADLSLAGWNKGLSNGIFIGKADSSATGKCSFTAISMSASPLPVTFQSAGATASNWNFVEHSSRANTYCNSYTDSLWCSCKPIANFVIAKAADSVVLTDQSINSEQVIWTHGDGTGDTISSHVHHFAAPGTYSICQQVVNDCGMDSLCQTIQIFPIGIDENGPKSALRVYPNPGQGSFTLLLPPSFDMEMNIRISDLKGDMVYTGSLFFIKGKSHIDLPAIIPGLYFIQLYNDAIRYRASLIISDD